MRVASHRGYCDARGRQVPRELPPPYPPRAALVRLRLDVREVLPRTAAETKSNWHRNATGNGRAV